MMGTPQDHLVFRNVASSAKAREARAHHRSTPASSTVTSSVGAPEYVDNDEETSEAAGTETAVNAPISSTCSSSLRMQIPVLHHLPLTTPLQPSRGQVVDPLAFKSLAGCSSTFEDFYRAYTDPASNPTHSFAVAPRMCLSTNSPGSSWDSRALRWHIPCRPYSTNAYGSGFSTGPTFSASYRPIVMQSNPGYGYGSRGVQVLPYQNYLLHQPFSSGNSTTGLMEMGDRPGWKGEVMASQQMGTNGTGWKQELTVNQEMGNRSGWKGEVLASQEMENKQGRNDEMTMNQKMENTTGYRDEAVARQGIESRIGGKEEMMPHQEEIPVKGDAGSGKCDLSGCTEDVHVNANQRNRHSGGLWWCGPGAEPNSLEINWAGQLSQLRRCEEIMDEPIAGELLTSASESSSVSDISGPVQLGDRLDDQMQKVPEDKHTQHISEMEMTRNVLEMRDERRASEMEQIVNVSLKEHVPAVEQTEDAPKVEQTSNAELVCCSVQELEQMQNDVTAKQLSETSVVKSVRNSSVVEKTGIKLEELQNASLMRQMSTPSQLTLVCQMQRIGNASNLPKVSETNPKWNVQTGEPCRQLGISQSSGPMEEHTQCSSDEASNEWDLARVQQTENFAYVQDPGNCSNARRLETYSDAEYMRGISQANHNWTLAETGHLRIMTEPEEFSNSETVQSTSEVVGQMENASQVDSNPQLFSERSIPWTRPSHSQSLGWNRVENERLAKPDQPNVYPLVNYRQSDEIGQRSRTEFFANLPEEHCTRSMLNAFWSNAESRGSAEEWCGRPGTSTDSSVGQDDTDDDDDDDDDVSHSFPPCFRGEVHYRELSTSGTRLTSNMQVRSDFDCITGQDHWSASTSQGSPYLPKLGVDEEKECCGRLP